MPKIKKRPASATSSSEPDVTGKLAPEHDPLSVDELIKDTHGVDMCYMCRAYSEENRPGFHPNEDRFFCEEHLKPGSPEDVDMFIVGVLDGHDGNFAADLVSADLPSMVFNTCFGEKRKVHDSHVMAFGEVENKVLHGEKNSTSGCCVNSCVVWGRYLWCANLGDCRAVFIPLKAYDAKNTIVETGTFSWMSRDLKASQAYEVERIRNLGGKTKDGRVEGLEPTRTIGDRDVKEKVPKGVISIVPETRMIDMVSESRASWSDSHGNLSQGLLVQGTDGIWDVVDGKDILNIIRSKSKSLQQLQNYLADPESVTEGQKFDPESVLAGVLERIAGDIVTLALSKGSTDDCTAIITLVSIKVK